MKTWPGVENVPSLCEGGRSQQRRMLGLFPRCKISACRTTHSVGAPGKTLSQQGKVATCVGQGMEMLNWTVSCVSDIQQLQGGHLHEKNFSHCTNMRK